MYPDNVSLTIAKIDSIPPENSGCVRADADHKRILRFHQSATAHWLWDSQTLSNPHRECSVFQQILFNVTSFVDHDILLSPTPLVIQRAHKHFQVNGRVCHFPGARMKGESMDSSVA